MFNGKKSQELIKAMQSACDAVKTLSAAGMTVRSVSFNGSKPVIRVEHCGYCDGLIHKGRAVFLEFGCGVIGRYRQGQFYEGGCKVVWSESLH